MYAKLISDGEALTRFAGVYADREFAHALAGSMNNEEVEALSGLLYAIGEPATGELWIQEHAQADARPDRRTTTGGIEPQEYIVPVDPMDELGCESCQ